jgi:3',5'-cyclic AMP phosphodiesterase CpdA
MRLLVLADLHLDEVTDPHHLAALSDAIGKAGKGADLMIVAGDLAENAIRNWPKALHWLGRLYPLAQTIVVPGNHDYYGGNLSTLDGDLARICNDAGCRFGQCLQTDLGDVRILTTTLWTDLQLFAARGTRVFEDTVWQVQMMPDYGGGAIGFGSPERRLWPEDTTQVHAAQKAWLTGELSTPWPGKTVVITHHAPSASVAGPITPLSPCFASNLEAEIEQYRPTAWLFGHTHRPAEARSIRGTALRNVSVGYE